MAVDFDRLKNAVLAFVRTALPRVDYYALYACTVSSQNSDGTLELTPDAKTVPGLSSVKYKPGIPGAVVTVTGNARVLLGFENGDPSKPYAIAWDGGVGTVTKLTINANAVEIGGGTMEAAALGDTLTTALNNISNWLTSHTHLVPGVGTTCVNGSPWTGTATSQASALTAPTIGTVKSGTVKTKT